MAATPKTKIFVGHLPDGCKNEDLQVLFEKYGVVKECDVINKYGFVHMSTTEEADEAIKNLNNFNLMGSCISVEPSKSKLHPEPGAPGRAKQSYARGGFSNGFRPSRGGYGGGFSNGFRPGPPFGGPGGDSYYDRPFGFGRERMRPYPPPYERRSPSMGPMREDFVRRPLPPPGSGDPYARPIPPLVERDDLYERRLVVDRTEYLYSRRSPPPTSLMHRPYWYADTVAGDSSRALPPSVATRRPAYF